MSAVSDQSSEDFTVPDIRRPCIALMGEFSAGKSTLANFLLGREVSPVKVTATQLPPVWYARGAPKMLRIDNQGAEIEIDETVLEDLSHRDTQAVRIRLEADVLEYCDIIDMPGTSDPNMPPEIWERMLSRVDGVIWCTPATQAWRQSEAAIWEQMPARLHEQSLLLITRMDKLLSQLDRDRVVARVRAEAQGLFAKVLPISLTQALGARDASDQLDLCGATPFLDSLVELVEAMALRPKEDAARGFEAVEDQVGPDIETSAPEYSSPKNSVVRLPDSALSPRRIIPKRVRPADAARKSTG